jgi:hypothetical protein
MTFPDEWHDAYAEWKAQKPQPSPPPMTLTEAVASIREMGREFRDRYADPLGLPWLPRVRLYPHPREISPKREREILSALTP